ncbi:MAG: HAD hydrolase-like protein [Eubacteriales bacterium]|nr:HAD hydrolase-like protein [Eubacteriales bacterium]
MHSREEWEYSSIEEMIEAFLDPSIRAVSFDMFDTLVLRPVERSTDVYELLDRDFEKWSPAQLSYRRIRTEAEAVLRRRIINGELPAEDITLDEIGEVLQQEFGLGREAAADMIQKERELEKALCIPRRSGMALMDAAVKGGKKVIVISDMYLTEKDLKELLATAGYPTESIDAVYSSADRKRRKITGSLFRYAAEELQLSPETIFHIGDSPEGDCRAAVRAGLHAALLPKTIDAYNAHGCAHQVEKICGDLTNWEAAGGSVGIGIMRQLTANRYFDNPFRAFDPESDYNRSPYLVGYGALGMEVLALVRWIGEQAERDRADKVIFMARDGYLPMKAYNRIRTFRPELPKAEYLPVSRRAVLPAMFTAPVDLYGLPVDLQYQTPRKLLKLLEFCDRYAGKAIRTEEEYILGFAIDEKLSSGAFQSFISAFIRERYDAQKHREAVERIGDFLLHNTYAPLTESAVLFDMGYSGRIPAAIATASGLKPTFYYFHSDAREHFRYEKRNGIRIRSFFDFNPYMESSLREYSYLEPAASCIGYTEDRRPVYDIGPAEGYKDGALAMQAGALDYIDDFLKYFSDYEREAAFRYHDAAMPFEAFIRYCRPDDREIYERVLIDDELWGGRRDIELRYLIETRLRKMPAYARKAEQTAEG